MKRLLLAAAPIITLISCTVIPTVTVSFPETIVTTLTELDSSQDELFIKANEWMIAAFNDAESVIQYSDKEAGTLIGKYLLGGSAAEKISAYFSTPENRVYAIIDLRVKDNKARLSIKPDSEWTYRSYENVLSVVSEESVLKKIEILSESLKKSLVRDAIDF